MTMIRLLCNRTIHIAQAILNSLDQRKPDMDDYMPDLLDDCGGGTFGLDSRWGDLIDDDGPYLHWSEGQNVNDNERCQRNAVFTETKPQVDRFPGVPYADRGRK